MIGLKYSVTQELHDRPTVTQELYDRPQIYQNYEISLHVSSDFLSLKIPDMKVNMQFFKIYFLKNQLTKSL